MLPPDASASASASASATAPYLPAAAAAVTAGRWPPVGSLTQLSAFISINLLNVGPSDKMHVLLSPKNADDAKTLTGGGVGGMYDS